ncbi:MAG: beta-1,6-N-acetylglucosaminyltransferase [Bacteroidota bacterium]|nr:beta-1,6-N-acetylglucosaminyltransferase [Bacteroidota bacterium]MDP4215149.1 beta-1,6-N-acetylglucosaminyltransferase [Bacteroidota bacterium]MDP4260378.1 beta-1,6-N-acetylglucosaminyltransferase [Bacteroidota bacterium]
MRIAHLILTHKNPAQLERLIKAMDHPAFDFYIHLDRKTPIAPFAHLTQRPNVYMIRKRAAIYWAGWGTIQATLNGFREILAKSASPDGGYDYINVMSGQDFPLKSAAHIFQYLRERRGKEFILCDSIEDKWKEAAIRVTRYHFINWRIPGKFRLANLFNKIMPPRKYPLDHKLVGRANWFTLTPAAATYVLDFLKNNPKVVRFFKYVWGADEFIFSTILYNSPFREQIVDNLVYVDWTGQTGGHPRVLGAGDFERLRRTDKLFGRKFDMSADAAIFGMLEEWIAGPEGD